MIVRNKSRASSGRVPLLMLALALALFAGSLARPARADDCVLPPPPSRVPDGSTASEQEMVTAMQTLKQYDGDVSVYLKCLEFEAKQNRIADAIRDLKHDAAVSQLQEVADKFNQQVRVFKSKHG